MRVRFSCALALVLAAGGCMTRTIRHDPGLGEAPLASAAPAATVGPFGLAIHGGAGTILKQNMTPELERAYLDTLTIALRAGHHVLIAGGSSVDAVEAAIKVLEDSPLFNAGKGAVYTDAGTVELDAAIMDGAKPAAGAVAALKHIRNPISLARLVMEKSPHVMLVGEGAELFAKTQHMDFVDQSYFKTERRSRQYEEAKQRPDTAHPPGSASLMVIDEHKFGTVGAVALDQHGNLAAGTSTGGTFLKMWGRVGDSPIIGAGTYADNASCAVSATGIGEYFIRNVVAADISARMKYGHASLHDAAEEVVMRKLAAQHGDGGVIAIDAHGHVAMPFNTSGMYRGYITSDGHVVVKIFRE